MTLEFFHILFDMTSCFDSFVQYVPAMLQIEHAYL
jgi:hypothetical protein